MDNSTYPGTETEISEDCGLNSNPSQELDLVNHWVNLTIEDEVIRGCKIRDEKCKTRVPRSTECRLMDINSSRSPFAGHCRVKSTTRCPTHPSSYGYSPQDFCSPPRSPSIKAKCLPKCPLRIAELAVPTKRQCIETWRTKCDILPPYMVQRLKQQVMNESPVVQIADAVTCFKRGKPKGSKSTKRNKKFERDSVMKNERMNELRKLCAIFGKKIAQKLITPQNLKLNPELNKISKIVADEVANLMKSGKFKIDNINDEIQAEISEKITVWISTVLEDTSYKLLEEDLRVKRQTEKSVKEDWLITLVKQLSRSERTSELEEEEGPVLDFIDDVIDNVMNICSPQDLGVQGDYSSQASGEDPDFLKNNEFDTSTPHTSFSYETGDNMPNNDIQLTIRAMQNEINKVIDSVVRDDPDGELANIELVNKMDFSNLVPKDNIDNINKAEENLDNDIYELPENGEPVPIDETEVTPIEDFSIANFGLDSDLIDDLENLNSEDKVSDVFGILAEEFHDGKDKKVQFSDIALDVRGSHRQLIETGISPLHDDHDINKLGTSNSNNSANIESNKIVFAPPNENLLNAADELWPQDIATPVFKVTASVSRSVTSLGNITENEEKLSVIIPENLLQKDVINKQGQIPDVANTKKKDEMILKDKNLASLNTTLPDFHYDNTNGDINPSQNIHGNYVTIESSIYVPQSNTNDLPNKYVNIRQEKPTLTNKTESTQLGIEADESDINIIYKAVQQKMKASYALSEPKFDYKVNPNTTPSWLRHDHGKGEPSEDSIDGRCRSKGKLNENEIRMWCKDLERMCINMDLWNSWLETTCKNIFVIKQKRGDFSEINKVFAPHVKNKSAREWIALKKDIDKDAILWTKLYQRANERLNTYKVRSLLEERIQIRSPLCSNLNKIVLDTMEDIDRMCLWIHRTITSTEYCMVCDCKKNFITRKL